MKPIIKLVLAGGAIGGIAISAHFILKAKKDKEAGEFLEELEKIIDPAGAGLSLNDAFDINYVEKARKEAGKPIIYLKREAAKMYAEDIHNAWGTFNDNEEKVYGVFRALKDKVAVSVVAKAYYDYKNKHINLIDDINSHMDENEIKKINAIVKNLPKWRLAESLNKK